jgi:hypothetical protein
MASPVLGFVLGAQLTWMGDETELEVNEELVDRFPALGYAFTGGIRIRLSK